MSKPKFLKPLIIGCACLVPIGLIVGLSVNWDGTKTISCLGSGGVKPFVEKFGEEFRKENNGYDVTVDSGGSTFGITQVAQGYCNYGDASKNPYPDVHDKTSNLESWQKNKMKTTTIGWEACSILYCLPQGLSKPEDVELFVGQENINYLYAAFSGFDEKVNEKGEILPLDKSFTSLAQFLTPDSKQKLSSSDLKILQDTQILPVARSGGATVSNSAFAFIANSNLDPDLTNKQLQALIGGAYGGDRTVVETDESNTKGYEIFNLLHKPGAMVYLTSAFTEKNHDFITQNKDYKFMCYKSNAQGSEIKPYTFENFDAGYDWVRPLNIICSIDENNPKYKDNMKFLNFIFKGFGSEEGSYSKLLKANGAKGLTNEQFKSLCINDNFLVSDIELEDTRTGQDKLVYGAIG